MVQKVARSKRYADDIRSYSTNEVAINWNAPLAWVTSYLDEKANPESGIKKVGKGSFSVAGSGIPIVILAIALVVIAVAIAGFVRRRRK